MYIKKDGKRFRSNVHGIVADHQIKMLKGPVIVNMTVHPPDKRKRDLDNLMKAVLDALQGSFYKDDFQVQQLVVTRGVGTPDGCIVVDVKPWSFRDES